MFKIKSLCLDCTNILFTFVWEQLFKNIEVTFTELKQKKVTLVDEY